MRKTRHSSQKDRTAGSSRDLCGKGAASPATFFAPILSGLLTRIRHLSARSPIGRASAFCVLLLWTGPGASQDVVPSFSVGPYLQNVTQTSIIVCWESDVPSDATIEYWEEGSQQTLLKAVSRAQRHEVLLDELTPQTRYRYRVRIPASDEGRFFQAGFRTAPTTAIPLTFAVYGDCRQSDPDNPSHQEVVDAIRGTDPAFVINTGDLVSYGTSEYYWGLFWATVAPPDGERSLAGNAPYYPTIGNHEYMTPQGYKNEAIFPYQSYFVQPLNGLETYHPEWADRFYSFRYGPAAFIVLDVNNDSDPAYDLNSSLTTGPPDIHPGSLQYDWLVTQLASANEECPFTFVFFHHSPYSTGPYSKGDSQILRFLDPLFRQYHVDAVFTSHEHIYERCETYVDDYRILYFVIGSGGANLYPRLSGWDVPGSWIWDELNHTFYTKAFDNTTHSFINVEMQPLANGAWEATFSGIRTTGEVFDVARLRRPQSSIELDEALHFSFESTAGKMYQVEYSAALAGVEMEWRPLGDPLQAVGPILRVTDDGKRSDLSPANGAVTKRFYRVQELP